MDILEPIEELLSGADGKGGYIMTLAGQEYLRGMLK